MIVAGSASPLLLASAAGGYNLTNSLRFRRAAGAYLYRTPSSASNRRTWTWSGWVKLAGIDAGATRTLFGVNNGSTDSTWLDLTITIAGRFYIGGAITSWRSSAAQYRDPSAWYHFMVAVDTTQATASNRIRMYVNGSEITSWNINADPSLNFEFAVNSAARHQIGNQQTVNYQFDGNMTEINFIDGQQLTPSSFGENNAQTGVWQPKRYAGSYGTNGFYLPFTDNSSLTTSSNVGLGKDFSGNGNYWTTNNISITSGATYDSMTDVPTLTSATASNYCVFNPLAVSAANSTISNGNLTVVTPDVGGNAFGTFEIPSTGKWYFEITPTANNFSFIGISSYNTTNTYLWQGSNNVFYTYDGLKYVDGTSSSYGSSYTLNDVIGVACDSDASTITFYKNNVSQGAISHTMTGMYPALTDGTSGSGTTYQTNFGQRPFAYTPPTGFVALNTFNLPTPTIGATASTQANKYMDVSLYTGNGTTTGNTQAITNSGGFQPDLVWIKSRSAAQWNILNDAVRGTNKLLYSDQTLAEFTATDVLNSFNSNGFTVGYNSGYTFARTNENGVTYVGWQWRASNTTPVTNTAGSITSTVSANTSSGFSIVTYTGTGSNATVGHGLGVAPRMVIVKNRTSGTDIWVVWHIGLTNASYYLSLNQTAAQTSAPIVWNSTAPTSTVFSVGTSSATNTAHNYVAYCFAEVAGFSRFGSYTGNGSSDGTFVFTGFRPRYVMVKRTDSTGNWVLNDTARSPFNLTDDNLFPNESAAEEGTFGAGFDFLSNGFKLRNSGTDTNGNGSTYIYMAFAENPFKYSLAR